MDPHDTRPHEYGLAGSEKPRTIKGLFEEENLFRMFWFILDNSLNDHEMIILVFEQSCWGIWNKIKSQELPKFLAKWLSVSF